MAQPTYYPLWATEDTTLPNTDQTNKIRPKTTLRETGWDKGQIPSAEEFNWQLNNIYQWIYFINEESLPLYLPKTGTSLTFTGDITGTATWDGDNTTSVELTSATITSATANPTINTLVKRDNAGGFSALQNLYGWAPAGNNFDYRIYDQVLGIQKGTFSWSRGDDAVMIYKGTSSNQQTSVRLYSDRVEITSPRATTSQGSNSADLTRKDYVDSQVNTLNNTITDLNTSLTNYINSRSTANLSSSGWWKDEVTGFIYQYGFNSTVRDDGYVTITLPTTFPNSFFSVVACPSYLGSVGETTSLGSHVHIISTSQFGLGVSDSRTGETVEGAYWMAVGR